MTSDLTLGSIDMDVYSLARAIMHTRKRREYLENHKYKVYQGKDGRWFTRLPKKEGGSKQIVARTKEDLEELIVIFYESLIISPTIEEVFNTVIQIRKEEGSISEPTVRRSKYDFIRFYSEIKDRKIESISSDEMEDFLRAEKIKHDLDAKGYAKLLSISRLIFRYARRKRLVIFRIDDVISDMDWGKNAFRKENVNDEVFSDEEIARLSSYLKEHRNGKHLGLLLQFATGLRIGELSALKWCDILDGAIIIRRTERCWSDPDGKWRCEVVNLPKTIAGERIVPIPKQAKWIIEELRRLNPDGEYVFMVGGSRTRTVYFRKAMSKACDMAGIKRKSPHKLRKTYASILLDRNLPEKAVIENMGHTSIQVTNDHYARRRRTIEERIKQVSGVPEFDLVAAVAKEDL